MNILLTGIDGYVGWPTALRLSREFPDDQIIGIDNLARRKWVEECGCVSAIPIESMQTRIQVAKNCGYKNINFLQGDLVDRGFVNQVISTYRPEVIVHLAAQPSAPYSHINGEKANFTQFNNNQSTRNLLWGLKEHNLFDCHFIETTTMGVYGAPGFPIPEGYLEVERGGGKDTIPYPGMAGSWYHMSKSNDINNLYLANKMWNITITDLRMAILYGTETEDTRKDPKLATRFDFDFYFGVVCNRFCAMALMEHPITIYGKGLQRKPQISLEDTVQSIANSLKHNHRGKMSVHNQVTEVVSIVELATAAKDAGEKLNMNVTIKHIPNPRVENETHQMVVENKQFLEILGPPKENYHSGIFKVIKTLKEYKETIANYRDRFIA